MISATPRQRVWAKLLDIAFISMLLGAARTIAGPIAGTASVYAVLLFLDAWGSPGKRLLGLKVVDASTGKACGPMQSVLRNFIFVPDFARAMLYAAQPTALVQPQLALGLLALVIMGLELRWLYTRADGRRLGDAFGDTRVVRLR